MRSAKPRIIRSLTKTYRRRALMAMERKRWLRNRRPAFVRRLEYKQRLMRYLASRGARRRHTCNGITGL